MPIAKHIAIIGAGLSGMACALILVRHGCRISLFESAAKPGQALRGFNRGAHFDTGLHYTGGLNEGGALLRCLRYLGLDDLQTLPFNPEGFDEIRFADTGLTIRLPVGRAAMAEALNAAFPDESAVIRDYLDATGRAFAVSPLLRGALPQLESFTYDAEPLDAWLRQRTGNAQLRAVLAAPCLLHGVSPERVPFTQHAYVAASYFDAVHTFAGGGNALIAALEARLTATGVELRCGSAVRALHCDAEHRLTGLTLADGTEHAADAAIYTAHPAALPDLLPPGTFKPAFSRRLRNLSDSMSAHMLFGVTDNLPACLDGRNLILYRDADLAAAFTPERQPEDGPFYVTACPRPDGRSAHGVMVMAPGHFSQVETWTDSRPGARPQAYRDYKAASLERMRAAVLALCPELGGVRVVDGATPLTLRDWLHAPQGGLYGCGHSLDQVNPLPVTHVPNLWLAGQSVVAPGLLGAVLSAFLACGFLIGHEHLQQEVLQCN